MEHLSKKKFSYLKQEQLTNEQKVVLEKLCNLFGYKNCRFLEIGSWLGDSTKVMAKIVKKFKGTVICIDNWKGSPTTDLKAIAENQDIYQIFRSEIMNNDLDDYVFSFKANSNFASEILKNKHFDLIFLDADHRYENVKNDILNYFPKLKKKGLFCGHDCEGYIKDYPIDIINKGLNQDVYQNLHCGVIKAVGELIEDVFISNEVFMKTSYRNNIYFENIFSQLKLDFNKNLIFLNEEFLIEQNNENIIVFNFKNTNIKKTTNIHSFYENIFLHDIQYKNNFFLNEHPVLVNETELNNIIFFKNKFYICPKNSGKIDFFNLTKLPLKDFEKYLQYENIKLFYKFSDIYHFLLNKD